MWVTATDFSYSGYKTSSAKYVTHDKSTGMLSCNAYDYYVATVTATHKPTGCTATFKMVINPVSAVLVGIEASDRNREEVLDDTIAIIKEMDYASTKKRYGTYKATTVIGYLASTSYNVFLSRSHGNWESSYTYIITDDDSTSDTYYLTSKKLKSYDLSNMKVALFVACYTGHGGEGANNLPTVAVEQGAECAVGFLYEIDFSAANTWTVNFFNYMAEGISVEDACIKLSGSSGGMSKYVFCGNDDTTLT